MTGAPCHEWAADLRDMTDSGPGLSSRCELVTYDFPSYSMLRRVWGWRFCETHCQSLESIAHHEAGHVAMLEWMGIPISSASITADGGRVDLPPPDDRRRWVQPLVDRDGLATATAAGMFHAGVIAEMMFSEVRWVEPIFYPAQTDFQRAEAMLFPTFGRHSSGAHAYAQRVALHVLSMRWARVSDLAGRLIRFGRVSWEAA